MRGTVLHCKYKDCQKLIAKDVILPVGSQLKLKCSNCGRMNCICSNNDGVIVSEDKKTEAIFLKI